MSLPERCQGSILAAYLRCEYLRDPLGMDVQRPRLAWTVCGSEPGQEQTAYQIMAATSEESLAGIPDLWDSGKVRSSESAHIRYAGRPLDSGARAYWCVRIWDRPGRPGSLSETAWWEMGLLGPSDWEANWIAGPEPSPVLRKTFVVSRPVSNARLYISGQGVYEARINGRPVSDQVLGPQLSFFPVRMLYDTFDVTGLLRQQQNAIAVQLAPGWYGGDRRDREAQLMKRPDGPRHVLIAQLAITHPDGSKELVATDDTWKVEASHLEPVKSHWVHCFQGSGERADAEQEPFGWDGPGATLARSTPSG